jgi:hypothetical protein
MVLMRRLLDASGLAVRRRIVTFLARYHARDGFFAIDIHGVLGLGARLVWCLEIAAYCRDVGLRPRFKLTYPGSAVDHFSELFVTDGQTRASHFVRINSIIELDLRKDYNEVLTVESASRLAQEHLRVRSEIIDEVDGFSEQRFGRRHVVGLHYRGTDKHRESPLVAYDTVYRNLDRYLELIPETELVYVATDDGRFLADITRRAMGVDVVYRDDAVRSPDGRPFHEAVGVDRSAVNRDALVNCLILARCHGLIKTPSILSACSVIFNPDLPVVMIGQPTAGNLWFPERALVRGQLFDPIE